VRSQTRQRTGGRQNRETREGNDIPTAQRKMVAQPKIRPIKGIWWLGSTTGYLIREVC